MDNISTHARLRRATPDSLRINEAEAISIHARLRRATVNLHKDPFLLCTGKTNCSAFCGYDGPPGGRSPAAPSPLFSGLFSL